MTGFLVSFCIISVILSVSKWLISDGEMKNITEFLCVIVFFVTVISLFFKADISFEAINTQSEDMYSQQLCESVAATVIAAVLDEEKLPYEKIEVKADKTDEDSIIISEVTVFSNKGDAKRTREILCSKTAVKNVEVISD